MTEENDDNDRNVGAGEYLEMMSDVLDRRDKNDEYDALLRFFKNAYEHTAEYESGEYTLMGSAGETGNGRMIVEKRLPYLSRLPLIGNHFVLKVRIDHMLAVAVQFGEAWEKEFPHNRQVQNDAALSLRELATGRHTLSDQKEAREIARKLREGPADMVFPFPPYEDDAADDE